MIPRVLALVCLWALTSSVLGQPTAKTSSFHGYENCIALIDLAGRPQFLSEHQPIREQV